MSCWFRFVTLQTLSTFPAWAAVEWHGTVVSHTVVTWFFGKFLSHFSSHLNLCAHLAWIATPILQKLHIFLILICKCIPDEHRGLILMKNVTKNYKKKNHVTTVWLTTVPCHSTTVHAGNVLNVCSESSAQIWNVQSPGSSAKTTKWQPP